ncbi:energy transducer TonB [Spirosoma sp. KNUC1025]|uniref:energy transducer TonB n=1 Tax=Spirosoma sp. KNUC1025 TaxID=2894082 RepID=UPI00386F43E8|nr:energy transducer TonB [Spirosoma sp. KNUC1025]
MAFIAQNYHHPRPPENAPVSGTFKLRFRITKRGTVDRIRVEKSPGFGADEEMIRVVKLTSGKWIPGKIGGKVIAMDYYLPVNIELE